MSNEKPSTRKRRFRWQRWGWMRRLGAGLGVLCSLAALGVAIFYVFAVRPDRRSVPFRQAMERLRNTSSATRLLGTPVEAGWWVRGHVRADSARLSASISGAQREGTLHVMAEQVGGAWHFSTLELTLSDNSLRLSLLDESRRREQQDAAPIKVPPRYRK